MIIALILFLIIGISFGLIGAGGSILSVPVLIYILGLNTELAMSYSFYLVGLTACFGFFSYLKKDLVNFKDAMIFAIPSIIGVSFSRYFVVPAIPNQVLNINKDTILIVLFAILMIASAVSMFLKKENKDINHDKNRLKTIFAGLSVGLIVGILGAGGGFLIIPALYNFLKIDIKKSIGTSLLIITANCLVAIISDLSRGKYISLSVLIPILLMSILGVVFGVSISSKVNSKKIKTGFSIFTIVLAVIILCKEIVMR